MYILIYILVLLVYTIFTKKSISTLISLLYVISLFGCYLLSPSKFMSYKLDLPHTIYLLTSLFLVIIPWNSYKLKTEINIVCDNKDFKILKKTIPFAILFLIINSSIYIYFSSFIDNYSSFKNDGDGIMYMNNLPISLFFINIISYLSSLSILYLPFHFYYLTKGEIKKALLLFICSLNYILNGLIIFSRSTSVAFILVYSVLYIFMYSSIKIKIRLYINIIFLFSLFFLITRLMIITNSRFGESDVTSSADTFLYHDSVIKNSLITSQISYLSQWYIYMNQFLPAYQGRIIGGIQSFPLVSLILDKVGLFPDYVSVLNSKLYTMYRGDSGAFKGFSTDLVYDLGYFWTYLILLVYYYSVKYKFKEGTNIAIQKFMFMIVFLTLPLSGIFGSCLNSIFTHITLLFCLFYNKIKYITK